MLKAKIDLKKEIAESLSAFAKGPLIKNAEGLFKTLGYQSQKTFEMAPNSVENFLATFDQKGIFRKDKALFQSWDTVDIVFQLSDEEVVALGSGQHQIRFDSQQKIDNRIMASYLFIAIQLKKGHYTRTSFSIMTREINKLFPMPVLVLFKYGTYLTFSIINRRLHKREFSKDVLEKVTLIKDIHSQNPHRAHIDILYDISFYVLYERYRFSSFIEVHDAWRVALDSTELNKRFYKELANWYFWALHEVRFPSQNNIPSEIRNPINVIRLITRIIFVWFVKEKGLIPEIIFLENRVRELLKDFSPEKDTYYKAILQNLFFATLSTDMKKRGFRTDRRFQGKNDHYGVHNVYRYKDMFNNPDDLGKAFENIPFLNGGLFECLDRLTAKPVVRIDGFSDRKDNELYIPNYLFFSKERVVDLNTDFGSKGKTYKVRGLIDLLQSYKFTISENTPLEEEIALDPELLGRSFENLLASYNEETRTTARKLTGSFYTPREIVNHMVEASLTAYLEQVLIREYENKSERKPSTPQSQQKVFEQADAVQVSLKPENRKIPQKKQEKIREKLSKLFAYREDLPEFEKNETEVLIEAINRIKILDPACGSGAFPMGILHRLVDLLHKLDPNNRRWKDKQIEKAERIEVPDIRQKAVADIIQAFENHELDYARKLYLIQNCIFGVDIQPVAVQIAKLRFFISLIVEQEIDDRAPNRGMMPLPNLETKIVAANTLIGFKGESPLKGNEIFNLESQLKQVRKRYFDARTRETKKKCEEKDKELRKKINRLIAAQPFSKDTSISLDQWDPYNQNEAAKFFDPEWMFGEREGFDIVIGNPPYVRQEKIRDLKPVLKDQYGCYTGMADLYVYFYERGFDLLRNNGFLIYISSNKYFRSAYGKKLRKFLGTRSSIIQLVDFGDAAVFTSIAYPSIILLRKLGSGVFDPQVRKMMNKKGNVCKHIINALTWENNSSIELFSEVFTEKRFALSQEDLTEDGWRLEPPEVRLLLAKLTATGNSIGDFVGKKIYRGIITGLNDAYVVDRLTKDDLIREDKKCENLFKPFLRGKSVKQWTIDYHKEYLIKIVSSANRDHPWSNKPEKEAEQIFSEYYPSVYNHLIKFKKKLIRRDDKGQYFWELRSCKYWEAFEKSKIIYPDIAKKPEFAFDSRAYFLANTLYFIPTSKKWLTALLNSSVVFWMMMQISTKIRGDFIRFFTQYVTNIPIPSEIEDKKIRTISLLMDKISGDESNAQGLRKAEIDARIADLYDIAEEEYMFVLKQTNMSEPFTVSALNFFRDIKKGKKS